MLDRDPAFWRALGLTEKVGCAVGAGLAETHVGRAFATRYQTAVAVPVLKQTIDNRLHLLGAEHLPRDESFVLAANHRSYFDLYAVMIAFWPLFAKAPYLYCPVRTAFFYEKPLGVLFNVAVCANAMYPPVFRDQRGRHLNRYAIGHAVHLLHWSPRTIIALHPEGRRSRGEDPYTLMPARPGVGRIGLAARRPIVPVFVNGLASSFRGVVRDRMSLDGPPVRVLVGAPVAVDDLYGDAEDPDAWREATGRTMSAITALGERDRAWMGGPRP